MASSTVSEFWYTGEVSQGTVPVGWCTAEVSLCSVKMGSGIVQMGSGAVKWVQVLLDGFRYR